jgi:hypothetical protein
MVVQADENDRDDQDNSADSLYLVARAQETLSTGLGEQKWQGGEQADGKADQAQPKIELYPFPDFMDHVDRAQWEAGLGPEALCLSFITPGMASIESPASLRLRARSIRFASGEANKLSQEGTLSERTSGQLGPEIKTACIAASR